MATCFGICDHHLAILQELKLNFSKFLYDGQWWSEIPKHVAIKIKTTKTKYIVVFEGSYKQSVYVTIH